MLDTQTLDRLNTIFKLKGWELNDSPNNLFDRFSNNLARFEKKDQHFILDITEKYNSYTAIDYENMLKQCLEKLAEIDYFDSKIIKVCPLLPYVENKIIAMDHTEIKYNIVEREVKSSNFVCYLFKSNKMSYFDFLSEQKIEVLSYLNSEDISSIISGESKLLLVDDYIGSGGTALKSLKSYLQLGLTKENIAILSLLIDKKGEELLKDFDVQLIKSNYEYFNLEDVKNLDQDTREKINRISKKLKVTKSYRYGYMETSALVSLIRTPNNSLPFYWFEKNSKSATAPFPRFIYGGS